MFNLVAPIIVKFFILYFASAGVWRIKIYLTFTVQKDKIRLR